MLNEYIDKKLKFSNRTVFIAAVLCGLAVGFVTAFAIVLSDISDNLVLNKLMFGTAFSSLLLLIVLNGYDLFTGNTMLLTVVHKKGMTKKVLLNLLMIYTGNLLGCILSATIIRAAGVHTSFDLTYVLTKLFSVKTEMSILKMILLGILANYFVCMGVYLSFKANTIIEKYLSLFFPICIFCVLGFEHSIANMFTLFYASFVLGESVVPVLINLLFVTIGNIIGGVLFGLSTKVKDRKAKDSQ